MLQFFISLLLFFTLSCQTVPKDNLIKTGNQLAQDGLYREALETYQSAIKKGFKIQTAHRNMGLVLVKLGEYTQAIKHIEASFPMYNDNFEANFYLAEAFRAQDNYADAIFRYKRSLEIRPKDHRALKSLAWSYYKIRYYSEALVTISTLRNEQPNDQQAVLIQTRTLLKLRKAQAAQKLIKTEIANANKKNLPYFYSVEGDVYFELKQYKEAKERYLAAIEGEPLLAGALLGLGKCFLLENRGKEAIVNLERALNLRPNMSEALYFLGKAYEGTDNKKSLAYYRSFYRQAASDPEFLVQVRAIKGKLARADAK